MDNNIIIPKHFDRYCIWVSNPMHLAEMVSYHGEAIVQEKSGTGFYLYYCILFNDGLEVEIDGGLIKLFFDIDESLWFKKFDQTKLRFQRFMEIRSNSEGYYAYYQDAEAYVQNDLFLISSRIAHTYLFSYTKKIGKARSFLGQINEITTANENFVIFKNSLYRLNHSHLINLEEDDFYCYPDEFTIEEYINFLGDESFSLIFSYTKETTPYLGVERQVRYEYELMTIKSFVTRIESYSFFKNMIICEIVIPEAVKSIGYYAFAFCGNLQNVIFEGLVDKIDGDIFTYSAVKHIIVPNGTISAYKELLPSYSSKIFEKKDYNPIIFDSERNKSSDNYINPELYEVFDNNRVGYINQKGKVVIPAQYSSVVGDFNLYYNKIAACGDEGWVIIDAQGNVSPLTKNGVVGKPIKIMRNRYLILTKGWNQHAIYDVDTTLMVVDYGVYDYIWHYNPFWDTLKVKRGSKWGIIMMNGAIILPPQYNKVIVGKDDYSYIDENGNTIKCAFRDHRLLQPKFIPEYRDDEDYWRESWYALTDGMEGDYPGDCDY